ncbi:MAG: NAD-dependent epimerase/dehydratase family protein [Sulfitobacter sp.]|nr:NAD-dependent epimerase/dehydratase family protein [Sulfitobacter sp.]
MSQSILLTGVTGFLAKHILLRLLNDGHKVRGSLRSMDRADEVREAVRPHLTDPETINHLGFVALDLSSDTGWDEACDGMDVLVHTASPFPLTQPRDEQEVIRPAVDGTLRAMKAAEKAKIGRVVLTSSTAAIAGQGGEGSINESDWTDLTARGVTPYVKSKTLAEQAAWDFVKDHPDVALTVINPGFILGPALDRHYGTSLRVIERALAAKDPAVPQIGFSTVDVRDVADIHVNAIDRPDSIGKRIAAVSDFMWFMDISKVLAEAYPARKVVTRRAPDTLVRILALFDPTIRQIVPTLGQRQDVSNARARSLFGMTFRPVEQAVQDAAQSVIDAGKGG